MNIVSRLLLAGAGAALVSMAQAQGTSSPFPNRPIRMIAPSSAGGPVDVIARVVAQGLAERSASRS